MEENQKSDNTYLLKPPLEVDNFIAIPFEQSPIIRHLCHMGVILHFLCSAGKLIKKRCVKHHLFLISVMTLMVITFPRHPTVTDRLY